MVGIDKAHIAGWPTVAGGWRPNDMPPSIKVLGIRCSSISIFIRPMERASCSTIRATSGLHSECVRSTQTPGDSQEELADRARVHRTFIGAIERSETNVSIDNISRISAALGVSAARILTDG